MVRRVMIASCGHGRVGVFYAPCTREGKPIVPMHVCTPVEQMRRHAHPDLMTFHPSLRSRQSIIRDH
jgi:hypothetical protein